MGILSPEIARWTRQGWLVKVGHGVSRKMQPWPPTIVKGAGWDSLYDAQRGTLPVLPTADEAVVWVNDLIKQIWYNAGTASNGTWQ